MTEPLTTQKRCWAEIDLEALRHNVALVRRLAGDRAGVMAIIKANAYSHGLPEIAVALVGQVEMFGVANVSEARAIRQVLPEAEIFILGAALPWERDEIVRSGFIPCISSREEAVLFNQACGNGRVRAHLVIDTGMGRMGVWQDDALKVACEVLSLPGIEITGVATHLPAADEDEAYTAEQLARFEEIVARLRELGITAPMVHALNSAGVIRFGSHAQGMVRAGLMLYGVSPVPDFQDQLRPVMTLKTRITLVREVAAGRSVSYGR
ncbi:MAG: alanine racemase, partial [Verrucomicrobiota bacterium]